MQLENGQELTESSNMTAIEFLFWKREGMGIVSCPLLPMSTERPCTQASKSELRRWLRNHAVVINGKKPGEHDEIEFPIKELVFFPNGKRKCTMM